MSIKIEYRAAGEGGYRPLGDDGNAFSTAARAWQEVESVLALGEPYSAASYRLIELRAEHKGFCAFLRRNADGGFSPCSCQTAVVLEERQAAGGQLLSVGRKAFFGGRFQKPDRATLDVASAYPFALGSTSTDTEER